MGGHAHASAADWRFREPEHTCVFASVRVTRGGFPVLMVIHRDDGDWVFSCGTTDADEHAVQACLGCVVDRDPTLARVAELPRGHLAFRETAAHPWQFVTA